MFFPLILPAERVLWVLLAVPILVRCAPANFQPPSLSIFQLDEQSSNPGSGLPTTLSLNASSAFQEREPLCDGGHFGFRLKKDSCWEAITRMSDQLSQMGPRVVFGTRGTAKIDVILPRRFSSCEYMDENRGCFCSWG